MSTPNLNAQRTALYRLYDAEGNLLYVGISVSAIARFKDHKHQSSGWAFDSARIDIEWFDNRLAALEAERQAIISEHPQFNCQHSLINSSKANGDQEPAGIGADTLPPFQRVQPGLLSVLNKISKSLAHAYLVECGVTPDYVQSLLVGTGFVMESQAGAGEGSVMLFCDQWLAGKLEGIPILPVCSLDFYELYRRWCKRHGTRPIAMNRAIDIIGNRPDIYRKRKRIHSNSEYLTSPKSFVFPPVIDEIPPNMSEPQWLGQCVADFRAALERYAE